MSTENGENIQNYLENLQYETSLGCENYGHKYSQNGTISCIRCGKVKPKLLFFNSHPSQKIISNYNKIMKPSLINYRAIESRT